MLILFRFVAVGGGVGSGFRLDWTMIEFQDNQPVIDLVSKKPRGLLIQLEEQGLLGRRANNKALLQVRCGGSVLVVVVVSCRAACVRHLHVGLRASPARRP